ncbi:DEAD/DEAH box helicase [Peterkaempfera sp. SMS 1(5)a]|uniref:DEAD/DEAH box helicase n=1 Tax=Peterkaempfera podocarpi TaxID=3232308 RepID=UPI00366EE40D
MSLVDDDRFAMPANGSAADAPAAVIPDLDDLRELDDVLDTAEEAALEEAAETAEEASEPTVTFGDLGLHDDIVRALAKRGVITPFPIQAATIPDALAGKDVLGRGRTGSGKTLSFGLPLLTRLAEGRTRAKRPRGLILVPTRELAMQVSDALEPYGSVLGLNLKVVCGGTSMPRQIYALERGVDVLVATPGRLRDLIDRGAASLDEVQIAVLDEADQMADMGFLPEVTEILDLVPAGGQRMLFSATLENEIDTLVKRYLQNPVTHEVDPSAGAVTTMTHHILVVKPKDKAPITSAIAARKGRTIIFVRTQMGADRVAEQLRESGVRADALHGGMTQGARTRTLGDFKDGYVNVLVATDVAARGIHVDGIDLVLNVDPAGDHKDYLHRSGRTARAGRSGIVVTLVLPHQRRGVFRLMEDAGVDASRHVVGGAFDADVARITGARSLIEVQAEGAAGAAKAAEREVEDMTRHLEKLQRRATELREDADRLAARVARERSELGLEEEPAEADSAAEPAAADEAAPAPVAEVTETPAEDSRGGDRPFNRDRDDRGGRSFERRDDRGGFNRDRGGDRPFNRDRDDRGGRSFERRDDRGGFNRDRGGDRPFNRDRDDRGGRSFERRDDRGGFNRDRGGDRPARSFDRPYGGDRDRDDRGGRSFERRDDRGGFNRDRGGDRPARSFDRPYGGDRDRDDRGGRSFERRDDRGGFNRDRGGDRPARSFDRPYGGDRDRGTSRPVARRDDHRSGGSRDHGSSRDHGGSRGFERRDNGGGFGGGDRKPRWKRNG